MKTSNFDFKCLRVNLYHLDNLRGVSGHFTSTKLNSVQRCTITVVRISDSDDGLFFLAKFKKTDFLERADR